MNGVTEFRVGDLVTLKSGGPTMTVDDPCDCDQHVRVRWFDCYELQVGWFPPACLETGGGYAARQLDVTSMGSD